MDKIAEVKGLRLLGLPNPASARAGVGSVDTTPQELQDSAARLLQAYQTAPDKPDIIAVHDPKQSVSLWGIAPLVLCGHLHTPSLTTQSAPPLLPVAPNAVSDSRLQCGDDGRGGAALFRGAGQDRAIHLRRPDVQPNFRADSRPPYPQNRRRQKRRLPRPPACASAPLI